ncbi:hypothetical protein ACN28I_22480 [Archangium gephyra]|uniref:hypothetical protein n=1 Tax=Archangium gephyra TaxID=48 RepID=UPI003B794360
MGLPKGVRSGGRAWMKRMTPKSVSKPSSACSRPNTATPAPVKASVVSSRRRARPERHTCTAAMKRSR